jgi:diguanylate cyclase (GGDEF)-like protein
MITVLVVGYVVLALVAVLTFKKLRARAAESERAALYDPATRLPNRTLLHDRVHQAIVMARRRGARVAVVTLGLDRFKEINDALGHHCGDLLLYLVGERLAATLRESDSVGRIGGDEFAVLLPEIGGASGTSRSSRSTATMPSSCFSAPRSRCTSPSNSTAASRCTRTPATSTPAIASS